MNNQKILTLKEAKRIAFEIIQYKNGDYSYKIRHNSFVSLIRNKNDLLEGKIAISCFSYNNRDYSYKVKSEKYVRLIRDDINILEGKKATECSSYDNLDYEYKKDDMFWNYVTKQ